MGNKDREVLGEISKIIATEAEKNASGAPHVNCSMHGKHVVAITEFAGDARILKCVYCADGDSDKPFGVRS